MPTFSDYLFDYAEKQTAILKLEAHTNRDSAKAYGQINSIIVRLIEKIKTLINSCIV